MSDMDRPVRLTYKEETLSAMGFNTSRVLDGDVSFEELTFVFSEDGAISLEVVGTPSAAALQESAERRLISLIQVLLDAERRADLSNAAQNSSKQTVYSEKGR